jgi:hypothetical protein
MKKHVNELKVGDVFRFDGDEFLVIHNELLTNCLQYLNVGESRIISPREAVRFSVVDVVDISKRVVKSV